ncbi:MAG: hypothetical protein Q8920_06785 [Bacillota bacterium]|nr:hypothetical protein [Bacillota bacterium]
MNFKGIKKRYLLIPFLVIAFSMIMIYTVQAGSSDPGSAGNPIVSQDYVDQKVNSLTSQIDSLKQQLAGSQAGGGVYQVVSVKAGQSMIGGSSTEIILRSGQAKAIGTSGAGISDLTGGKDLLTGYTVAPNHLLLVPRDDGRGIKANTDLWVMVKGAYKIQ